MSCGLGSTEEIAQCIVIVKSWIDESWPIIQVVSSWLGIGTFALISILVWYLKKAKRDIELSEQTASALRATSDALRIASKEAIEEKSKADTQARLATTNLRDLQQTFNKMQAPANEQIAQLSSEVSALKSKIEGVRSASAGETAEFWERPVGRRIANYETSMRDSIPIVLFANQKGGVGKTTLSANVAACLASRGERVLAIDLDYQGSMTGLMMAQADERPDEFPSMIELLHAPILNELWPSTAIQTAWKQNVTSNPTDKTGQLDYVTCWYSFEPFERNMEYLWLLGDSEDDIRFRLARALLSEHVQTNYDRVIIDAPPRITSGFINGFCASTHLFVPTIIDYVSARAVKTFATQFSRLAPILNPVLKFSGVIPTMTNVDHIPKNAQEASRLIEISTKKALNTHENYLMRNAVMKRSMNIPYSTDAGVPYLQDEQTHPMFDKIADEIARRAPLRT